MPSIKTASLTVELRETASFLPSGVSWCGIFAAWVLRKSGLDDVRWVVGSGIVGKQVKQVAGNEGFSVGDVIVIKGAEVHHAIVSGMPDIIRGRRLARNHQRQQRRAINQDSFLL